MSIRQMWDGFHSQKPLLSLALVVLIGFDMLRTLALLSIGRWGDAVDAAAPASLLIWIVCLYMALVESGAKP